MLTLMRGSVMHTNHFDTLIGVAKLRGHWSQFQQNDFVWALKLPWINGFLKNLFK